MNAHIVLPLLAYYVFAAAIGAMLPPEPGRERSVYGFWYRLLQILAANGQHALQSRVGVLAAAADDDAPYVRRMRWLTAGLGAAFIVALVLAGFGHRTLATEFLVVAIVTDIILALRNHPIP
jgi:hypothetical protein